MLLAMSIAQLCRLLGPIQLVGKDGLRGTGEERCSAKVSPAATAFVRSLAIVFGGSAALN